MIVFLPIRVVSWISGIPVFPLFLFVFVRVDFDGTRGTTLIFAVECSSPKLEKHFIVVFLFAFFSLRGWNIDDFTGGIIMRRCYIVLRSFFLDLGDFLIYFVVLLKQGRIILSPTCSRNWKIIFWRHWNRPAPIWRSKWVCLLCVFLSVVFSTSLVLWPVQEVNFSARVISFLAEKIQRVGILVWLKKFPIFQVD